MKTTSILLVTRGDAGWDRYVPDLQQQSQPPDQFITVIDRTTSEAERQALAARLRPVVPPAAAASPEDWVT